MSNLINYILENTIGYNLKRVKIRKVDKVKVKPIYVEFVGVAGVGKTTLYENVFKQVNSKWRDIHEFQRIFSKHIDGETAEYLSCYQELAQHKMKSVVSYNYNGIDQMKLIKYFHSVLIEDSLVYLYNNKYNVISDEGLIHNFGESILALFKSNKEEFESLMKHRAIIYCKTSAEIVAKRILERERKTGKLLPQHKVDSFDKLVLIQKKTLDNYSQILDFSSQFNIPILSIDTSDSMTQNIDQVKHFLTELIYNK